MVKDTIRAVKQAENEATKLAKETAGKREQMIEEAKRQVAFQDKELLEKLLVEREKALKDATQQNEALLKEAKEQALEEINLLKEQAAKKKVEVYQLLIHELV